MILQVTRLTRGLWRTNYINNLDGCCVISGCVTRRIPANIGIDTTNDDRNATYAYPRFSGIGPIKFSCAVSDGRVLLTHSR